MLKFKLNRVDSYEYYLEVKKEYEKLKKVYEDPCETCTNNKRLCSGCLKKDKYNKLMSKIERIK